MPSEPAQQLWSLYFRISQPDLLRYVETFAAESPLPVFLYNIPALTKTAYDPQTISRAAIFSRIAGLKDSSGDLDYLASVVRSTGAEFPGADGPGRKTRMNAMQAHGPVGGVGLGPNLQPGLFVDLYKKMASGDIAGATKLQSRVRQISDALYTVGDRSTSYLRGLKSAMAAAGLCSEKCALPLAPFATEERRLLESRWRSLECTL